MTTASQKTRATRPVPAMASRHFWFIADTIAEARENAALLYEGDELKARLAALESVANAFAGRLKASNGQFRSGQFLDACGIE